MPRRARPLLPQQARPRARRLRRGCAPAPHLRRPFRAYILGYTSLAPVGSDAPPRVPAPAAAGAPPQPATSSRPPRTFAAPSPSLPRIYPRIYIPLPDRFGCPAARVRSAAAGASLSPSEGGKREAPSSPAGKAQLTPIFPAAPTSVQPPFSSRSRSPWHTAPRRWCGCHGRDTAAGRARFGRGRIRSG